MQLKNNTMTEQSDIIDCLLFKAWRVKKGLKQSDIARQVGCCQTLVSKFERGLRVLPSTKRMFMELIFKD